jgi:hypothetical protein
MYCHATRVTGMVVGSETALFCTILVQFRALEINWISWNKAQISQTNRLNLAAKELFHANSTALAATPVISPKVL